MPAKQKGKEMLMSEREDLKSFARQCGRSGDTQSLVMTLVMISHWMRQSAAVGFSEYASQWVKAQSERTDGNESTEAMAEQWPFAGGYHIYPRCSDYYIRKINPDERF